MTLYKKTNGTETNMNRSPQNGVTLIELLVAMAAVSIVMAAIVSTYTVQVRAKNTQEIVTDMNQTARAVLEIMTHEIRLAGLDPTGNANARIVFADVGELVFSIDNGDGTTNESDGDCCDANEQIRYHLSPVSCDADDDGVNDSIVSGVECNLGRETGRGLFSGLGFPDPCPGLGGGRSGLQPLARNVDVLNFVYLADTDGDGNPAEPLPTPVPNNQLDDIRAIQITVVARAGTKSEGFFGSYTDTQTYSNLQGQTILPAQNDHFRRLQLSAGVACWNLEM